MKRFAFILSLIAVLVLTVLASACSAPTPEPVVPAELPEKTTRVTEEEPTPETPDDSLPLAEKDQWDVVLISDSTGGGVVYLLKDMIEQDTGKEVTPHGYSISGLPAMRVLKALRGDTEGLLPESLKNLQGDVAKAEMVIFFANPAEIPEMDVEENGIDICMNFRLCQAPTQCEVEDFKPFVDVLDQVYQEIYALREGKETIIRSYTFYNPLISGHQECGTESACTKCWDNFNNAFQIAAEKNGVPLVDVYSLFNGADHQEDPLEKGYIGPDKIHPNEEGIRAIAELIREAGYDPVKIP